LDPQFNAGSGIQRSLSCLAIQIDSKILVGGTFTNISGQPFRNLARLHPQGEVDLDFSPGSSANDEIRTLRIQQDGKILASGFFTNFNGFPRNRIVRLFTDGRVDPEFDPVWPADGPILASWILPDHRVLAVGGEFLASGGTKGHVIRLQPNGSQDDLFHTPEVDGFVRALFVQNDGRIVIGGSFNQVDGQVRSKIARLQINGEEDRSFDAGAIYGAGIWTMAPYTGGGVLIAGIFTNINGFNITNLARLNPYGSLDTGFCPQIRRGTNYAGSIETLTVQADGKILIGGFFDTVNNVPQKNLLRLMPDGTRDVNFQVGSGPDASVMASLLQPDGRLLIGGGFSSYDGEARKSMARLLSDCPPATTLAILLRNKSVELVLSGQVGQSQQIQFVEALGSTATWKVLADFVMSQNQVLRTDETASGSTVRFYRMMSAP